VASLMLTTEAMIAEAPKDDAPMGGGMGGDSWLSKNIRPMSLVAIFVGYFIFAMMSAFGLNANESYVQLLGQWGMLIMGAYFGGRTIEKLADMRREK